MLTFAEYMAERNSNKELYHDSYTDAVDTALAGAKRRGFITDPEETAQLIGVESSRPKRGKTTSLKIPVYKDKSGFGGKPNKYLLIQVFNHDGRKTKPFELNYYLS